MPELPEVESVCRELKPHIEFKKIVKVQKFRDKIRNFLPASIEANLINKKITDVRRLAKYIIITFNECGFLVFHLGMTGKLIIKTASENINKHDHLVITLNDKTMLVFNDARRFGVIDYFETIEELKQKYLLNIGAEPLTSEFNTTYLIKKLANKKTPIKKLLMENNIVVGIGNIYAVEILFKCSISPLRLGEQISADEATKIVESSQIILQKAIELNGSSFRDYVLTNGTKGGFQNHFFVYGRYNQACKICATLITKITQAGRTTFYCPSCQQ